MPVPPVHRGTPRPSGPGPRSASAGSEPSGAGMVGRSERLLGRTIAIWSPDWPVLAAARAAGLAPSVPAAVLAGGVGLACPSDARAAGVGRGLRGREGQDRRPPVVGLGRGRA